MLRSTRCLPARTAGFVVTLLFLACHSKSGGPKKNEHLPGIASKTQSIQSTYTLDGLRKRLETLEARPETSGKGLILLAETGDPESESPGKISLVTDSQHWPDSTLTSFTIAPDQDGRPELLHVSPQSESGDWTEMESFLFDGKGQVIFWRHEFNWFGEGEKANHYQIECAWDAFGKVIGRQVQGENPVERTVTPVPLALTARSLFSRYRLDAALSKSKLIY